MKPDPFVDEDSVDELLRKALESRSLKEIESILKLVKHNDYLDYENFLEGLRLEFQENYSEAISLYEKAISLDPQFLLAYQQIGNCYVLMEEYQKAIGSYKYMIGAFPYPLRNLSSTYYNLGIAHLLSNREREAIFYFQKSILEDEAYFHPYKALINLYAKHSQHERNFQLIEKFRRIFAGNVDHINSAISRLLHQGVQSRDKDQSAQAEKYFALAHQLTATFIQKYPENGALYYNLACWNSLMNNEIEAVQELTRAIALDDSYKEQAAEDSDFDNIRHSKRFGGLVPKRPRVEKEWLEKIDHAVRGLKMNIESAELASLKLDFEKKSQLSKKQRIMKLEIAEAKLKELTTALHPKIATSLKLGRAQLESDLEKALFVLNVEREKIFNELGLEVTRHRMEVLKKLTQQTKEALSEISTAKELPDNLRKKWIEDIMATHNQFQDHLVSRLGEMAKSLGADE